ncbi:hypothetical protein PN36_00705 [Candidatus Thiomargarita nelsonii]|uniref:Uncharacterized protein n=1 Tax=Candidatus Thiomargarita nelsonii TaxID=1003181 RepID=A0A4E0R7S2_9GAMM|nr:hypothetical protein PN36_00705 [Candidatus Thiomargarita nelsonii]
MKREHSLKLSQRDAVMLINALDTNPKPNVRLQQAAKRYESKTQSGLEFDFVKLKKLDHRVKYHKND